jgi:23S rRNA (adenine2503-C2)-methyltransferase
MAALADLDPAALAEQFAEWGYKSSHAARVLRAFYAGREIGSSSARGLPQGLVGRLQAFFQSSVAALATRQVASDGTPNYCCCRMGRRFPIADILAAADRFQARRGRPVTIQYCLLAGVNDSLAHARMLADLLASRRMHINLLRYNPTGLSLRGVAYEPSSDEAAAAFVAVLRERKLVAHFPRSRGPDIDAACGQLRRRSTRPGLISA